ncbi:RNA polymerase III-inhibiting protein maf1 [Entomortierella chlamydospora]|uniref:RNA polymerase III-inhibiting protein maf1 n=1 Tax=Entomortierella chlamydospora TaxID=101097 RepID=A0A9P6MZ49_9FUNG|nr:RNA polymerase III-inhibiting protein maf1 [Entomortierella chlamydospora]
MKFLEYAGIDAINSALVFETPECKVYGRVEPYSCKAAGADKKLYKQIEIKYDPSNSPPDEDGSPSSFRNVISPFGPLDQPASRRTLFYLIGTLNASFPDYDFSDAKPEQFRKEPSVSMVVNSVNATLLNHGNDRAVKELRIWDSIDNLIDFEDSDVYSYNPESDSDPNDEEGGGTFYGAPSEDGDDDFSDMSDDDSGFGRQRRGMRYDYDEYVDREMDF